MFCQGIDSSTVFLWLNTWPSSATTNCQVGGSGPGVPIVATYRPELIRKLNVRLVDSQLLLSLKCLLDSNYEKTERSNF
jgi:hypothetical protein